MNEIFHHIRKKFIDALTNQISISGSFVPIYNRVPFGTETPFIRVYSYQMDEIDQNQTTFTGEYKTRIEAITGFDGDDGGEYQCNLMVDGILEIIRTRTNIDLSTENFNVYTTTVDRIRYFEDYEDDKTYFRAIIEISNRIEKTT
jgi:hypothetical protein